jgi:anti-sigma factor RsiW
MDHLDAQHRAPDNVRELLNAYLDREIDERERSVVESALAIGADLRTEYEQLRQTRQLVRDLPLLEMPPGLLERIDPSSPLLGRRPRRRIRTVEVMVSAIATVAVWSVLVGTTGGGQVAPDVASVFVAHQSAAESTGNDIDSGNLPASVGVGLDLLHVRDIDGMRQATYGSSAGFVSVFVLSDRVDWDQMPEGDRVAVGDGFGWFEQAASQSVLAIDRADGAYVVVGTSVDQVVAVAELLPDPPRSVWERVIDASNETVEFFGFSS